MDPHKEHRPAHTFAMDLLTFDVRSFQQCKYIIVLKCIATKCIRLLPLYLRSDAQSTLEQWVEEMRKSPFFYGMQYPAVSKIVTDRAGEWSHTNRSFNASMRRIGVEMQYATKDRHERTNPHAERQVSIVEVVIKSLLMETSLPPLFWQAAASNAEFLLNRLPVVSHEANVPPDYDVVRPIEAMTRGAYSRAMISKDLSWFVPVGTLALVHCEKVKASNLKSKCRWGVATGMLGSQVEFRCPMRFTRFFSKSFKVLALKDGLSYSAFLGLPPLDTVRKPAHLPTDSSDNVTVYLPRAESLATEHRAPITQVWSTDTLRVGAPDGEIRNGGNGPQEHDQTRMGETTANSDIAVELYRNNTHDGGTVRVVGPAGALTAPPGSERDGPFAPAAPTVMGENNFSDDDDTPEDMESSVPKSSAVWAPRDELDPQPPAKRQRMDDVAVIIPAIPGKQLQAAQRYHGKWNSGPSTFPLPPGSDQPHPGYHVIRGNRSSFDELCKLFKVRSTNRKKYRSVLIRSGIPNKLLTPDTRLLPRGMAVPKPSENVGAGWPVRGRKSVTFNESVSLIPATESCDWGGSHKIEPMPTSRKRGRSHMESNNIVVEEYTDIDIEKLWARSGQWVQAGITMIPFQHAENVRVLSAVVRKKKKYYKKKVATGAVGSLHEPPPTTMEKALNHPTKSWEWLKAILDEWKGLEDLGVLTHNHTIKECQELGITASPVPLTVVLTHKTGEEGDITKRKCRIAVIGELNAIANLECIMTQTHSRRHQQ